jgi:hypothetical protein
MSDRLRHLDRLRRAAHRLRERRQHCSRIHVNEHWWQQDRFIGYERLTYLLTQKGRDDDKTEQRLPVSVVVCKSIGESLTMQSTHTGTVHGRMIELEWITSLPGGAKSSDQPWTSRLSVKERPGSSGDSGISRSMVRCRRLRVDC